MFFDDVDLNILSILQNNTRTPFTKIAQKLGVSDATIYLRVKKMEEMGLIEKYTLIINEEKIGKPVITYVMIRVDPGAVENVCTKLMELDEIYEISEIHEQYDILVKIRGRNLESIRDTLIRKIRSIPNVLGSEAHTVYKTWKRDVGVRIEDLREKVLVGE